MVDKAKANLGGKMEGVLLVDRGFLSGEDLWRLKHEKGLDFVIPARDEMAVCADARGLKGTVSDEVVRKERVDVAAYSVKGLKTYDAYRDPKVGLPPKSKRFDGDGINAVVVTRWDENCYGPGKEPVFLTTLPVDDPLKAFDTCDLRSLIENEGFRELKQGWNMGKFPKKTRKAACAHVMLTLSMYAMANAFRTKLGQKLPEKGIRRYRKDEWEYRNKVMSSAAAVTASST